MINLKLKRLIRASAEVLALYQEKNDDTDVEIIPFYDKGFKDTEIVTMIFKNVTEFNWDFLEPLAKYFTIKGFDWSINSGSGDKPELTIDIT